MDTATARTPDVAVLGFEDGLGRRYRVQTGGEQDAQLEILCFRPELTDIPAFEFALRERVVRLAGFQHAGYAQIRRVDRLNGGTLALFSESTPGVRVSELLAGADRRGLVLDVNAALCMVRQLAPAVALLPQTAHVANGSIGPERLILTPQGQLVVVEFAVGGALEQLHYSRDRYWQDLRIALPPSAGLPRFDECADVTQLGMTTLSLLLGRPVGGEEYPSHVEDLVAAVEARSANGDREPIAPALRTWLRRALQLDVRTAFQSPAEAQAALEQLLAAGPYTAESEALSEFLDRYLETPRARTVEPEPEHDSMPAAVAAMEQALAAPAPEPPAPAPAFDQVHPELRTLPDDISDWPAEDPADAQADADEEWHPIVDTRPVRRKAAKGSKRTLILGGVGLALLAAVIFGGQRFLAARSAAASTGTLAVNSNPPGALVLVDGVRRGQTPFSASLPAGPHNLVVQGDGEPRAIPVTILAGATSSQYIELPKAAATVGMLQIWTDPSGARVIVDGEPRGTSPLTVTDLATGEHTVRLENDLGGVTHNVMVVPGVPASLVVPMSVPQGAVVSGWLALNAPVEMQLYEQGRLLGTSGMDRIMLSAGRHDIDIVNETLAFRARRTVQVTPGRVTSVALALPKGVVALNAVPWASVSIDGESVGDTPIGNLSVPIGPHEVVFRNPQFPEQRRVINVTLDGPVRLSLDLTKK